MPADAVLLDAALVRHALIRIVGLEEALDGATDRVVEIESAAIAALAALDAGDAAIARVALQSVLEGADAALSCADALLKDALRRDARDGGE